MQLIRTSLRYSAAYLTWAVVLLLGLWLAHLARATFLGGLALLSGDSVTRAVSARFYDKVFTILLGLLWLVLMIGTETYFRNGIRRRDLLKRCARVVGPELLLIFIADAVLLWLQGFPGGSGWRWLAVIGEFSLGIVLLRLGWGQPLPALLKTRPV